ncbi:hypothetical protein SAMN02745911_1132 [Aureimonas altamirensis DSM 21988]|uniref:Glycosyltransferase 2-like domain-containing protein n=2 Tax=Aureimonas altamirensis TaxID=370622 RepID=A0A0P0YX50_9HYPH|nr:hypothetical protein [Aureimonas altamirensis]BAT25989.1 hypothetical protein [Aureimonas altamirensis]SHI77984.1 hypothetical protein SAMN02745911_1132 [Aureimonas altamirensis DSM 21988]
MTRCPVCFARAVAPTRRHLVDPSAGVLRFPLACLSCGLLMHRRDAARLRNALSTAFGGPVFAPPAELGFDMFTLRIAATRFALLALPSGRRQKRALSVPHSPLMARARLTPMDTAPRSAVSLGIMCRADRLEACVEKARRHLDWASEAIVLCDGAARSELREGRLRIAYRPMDGDFAGQRNALQDLCESAWMLQLDDDETVSQETASALPALARAAEAAGVVSIGLARRNMVDGVLSDLFPDTQYRLNRRDVRYRGQVHERPDRPWQRSTIALHGAIEHTLDSERVARRSRIYEQLSPGKGRLSEARELLTPYRP